MAREHKLTFVNNKKGSPDNVKRDELSVNNFNNICRTCLKRGEFKPILSLSFEEVSFKELFETCISVTVMEDDNLPKNICNNCIMDMVHSYYFLNKCWKSNDLLTQLIINNKNAPQNRTNIKQAKESAEGRCGSIIKKQTTRQTDFKTQQIKQNGNIVIKNYKTEVGDCGIAHVKNEKSVKEEGDRIVQSTSKLKLKNTKVNIKKEWDKVENIVENNSKAKTSILSCSSTCTVYNKQFKMIKKFSRSKNKMKHMEKCKYVCSICGKIFIYGQMLQHMQTHSRETPFECKFCFKKFSFEANLQCHVKSHTGEKSHKCRFCGIGFIQAQSLTVHTRSHTQETLFVCSHCGKRFTQSDMLKLHSHNMHKMKNGKSGQYKIRSVKFICDICGKELETAGRLEAHKQIHSDKKFLCNMCDKVFFTKVGLESHCKIHMVFM